MTQLGKFCAECRVPLTAENRGRWSPYFCAPCDKTRVERISQQFKEIDEHLAAIGVVPPAKEGAH